jgi:hypothetical protein
VPGTRGIWLLRFLLPLCGAAKAADRCCLLLLGSHPCWPMRFTLG